MDAIECYAPSDMAFRHVGANFLTHRMRRVLSDVSGWSKEAVVAQAQTLREEQLRRRATQWHDIESTRVWSLPNEQHLWFMTYR